MKKCHKMVRLADDILVKAIFSIESRNLLGFS